MFLLKFTKLEFNYGIVVYLKANWVSIVQFHWYAIDSISQSLIYALNREEDINYICQEINFTNVSVILEIYLNIVVKLKFDCDNEFIANTNIFLLTESEFLLKEGIINFCFPWFIWKVFITTAKCYLFKRRQSDKMRAKFNSENYKTGVYLL